jgi:hypothetical protein
MVNVYVPAGGFTYELALGNDAVTVRGTGLTLALAGVSVKVSDAPAPVGLANVAALMNRSRAVSPACPGNVSMGGVKGSSGD